MATGILVIAEHRDGKIKGVSKEALTLANRLSSDVGDVTCIVLGRDTDAFAQELAAYGGARTLRVEAPELDPYTPEAFVAAVSQVIAQESPALVLASHTYQSIDFFPRLAAAHDAALVPDVTDVEVESGGLVFRRKVVNGKLDARCTPNGDGMVFASLQQGAFPAGEAAAAAGPVETCGVDLGGVTTRSVVKVEAADAGEVDLTAADIIVAGGRGVGGKDKFQVVFDLADSLGAAVGASRPPCDSEWVEHERQIGSSGQVVAPKLYVAVGISGAIQHLVGMRGSQCIVAINKDPNAAIFQDATYGIVGDLHEIVPALIEAVREAKEA